MTLQEVSDRLEIMDLLTKYAAAIDKKDIYRNELKIWFLATSGSHCI